MKQPHVDIRDPDGVFRLAWGDRELFRWSWRPKLLRRLLPAPFPARHAEYSLIASLDDDVSPSARLLRLTLQALPRAMELRLDELDRRVPADFPYPPSPDGRGITIGCWRRWWPSCNHGVWWTLEPKFLANLRRVPFAKPLLVLDDIRVWTMLKVWREIPDPKLDGTSFGHWTGTGLVDWGA